uniref:Uncharacterized protein n=1 Tax=Physcomitrium patens TaxID=3218 RepID=A0A7I3Z0B7_PHYPA
MLRCCSPSILLICGYSCGNTAVYDSRLDDAALHVYPFNLLICPCFSWTCLVNIIQRGVCGPSFNVFSSTQNAIFFCNLMLISCLREVSTGRLIE